MNLVESTNPPTVKIPHQARWIELRNSRSCDDDRVWIFTDGSSLGGYGAVILRPGLPRIELNEFEEPTTTKNVGAELNGLLLGLRNTMRDERVVIVSDYLGVAAWMTGNWKIKDDEVRHKIREARRIVQSRGLDVDFIHHAGHQKDDSEFTKWNTVADRLATAANRGK